MCHRPRVELQLHFCRGEPQLSFLRFDSPFLTKPIISVRNLRVRAGEVSFRWTPGTIALSAFFLRAKLNFLAKDTDSPVLSGSVRSPAATLAHAVLRYRRWLIDLFGVDFKGKGVFKNLVLIQNLRHIVAGPVRIYLRDESFAAENISISLENMSLDTIDALKSLESHLLQSFESRISRQGPASVMDRASHTHAVSASSVL